MTKNEIREQLIDARNEYISLIKADLLGPGSEFNIPDVEHELISSSPSSRYSIGILYPQGNKLELNNNEVCSVHAEEGIDPDDKIEESKNDFENIEEKKKHRYEFDETANENLDDEIELSTQYMASSMGLTFLVKGTADIIKGKISFATLHRTSKNGHRKKEPPMV